MVLTSAKLVFLNVIWFKIHVTSLRLHDYVLLKNVTTATSCDHVTYRVEIGVADFHLAGSGPGWTQDASFRGQRGTYTQVE